MKVALCDFFLFVFCFVFFCSLDELLFTLLLQLQRSFLPG